jgi:RHS repeat-associated protein
MAFAPSASSIDRARHASLVHSTLTGNPLSPRGPGAGIGVSSGLYYDPARYYDSGTGRSLGQDPMGFVAGDTDLYWYVGNEPSTSIDATGLTRTPPWNVIQRLKTPPESDWPPKEPVWPRPRELPILQTSPGRPQKDTKPVFKHFPLPPEKPPGSQNPPPAARSSDGDHRMLPK